MTHQVLVAGGAGFIGCRLAVSLARHNPDWSVVAFDNLSRRGSELNLSRLGAAGVQFVHGDIRCQEDLCRASLESQTVIDCAAEPSVLAGYHEPRRLIEHNLIGTLNLLEKARLWGARFVFLSSSRVYPIRALLSLVLRETPDRFVLCESQTVPGVSSAGVSEAMDLTGFRSLYGASKLSGEHLVEEYHHAFGLPAVINRCSIVSGPGQMAKSDQGVFALWVAAHVYQRPLRYIGFGGQGLQVRDVIHVDDLADLIELQLRRFDEVNGETFNVGGGPERSLSLKETTRLCASITNTHLDVSTELETRPGDVPWIVADSRRIRQRLDWCPQRSARETLEDTAGWIIDNRESLKSVLE